MLWSFLVHSIRSPPGAGLAAFLVLAIGLGGLVVSVLVRCLVPAGQRLEAARVAAFAASVQVFACDYALDNPLFRVGAMRPEESSAFIFAASLDTLRYPVFLHLLVLWWLVVSRARRRAGKLPVDPT